MKTVNQKGETIHNWVFFSKKNIHFFLGDSLVVLLGCTFQEQGVCFTFDLSILSSEVALDFWWQQNKEEEEEAERTRCRGKDWWNGWQGREQQCLKRWNQAWGSEKTGFYRWKQTQSEVRTIVYYFAIWNVVTVACQRCKYVHSYDVCPCVIECGNVPGPSLI